MLFVNKKYESLDRLISATNEKYNVGAGFTEEQALDKILSIAAKYVHKDLSDQSVKDISDFVKYMYNIWDSQLKRNPKDIPFRFDPNNKNVKIADVYKGYLSQDSLSKYHASYVSDKKFILGESAKNGITFEFGAGSLFTSNDSKDISATDMELVIAFAYNKQSTDDDETNVLFVSGDSKLNDKDRAIIDYYYSNKAKLDLLASKLKSSAIGSASMFRKLKKSECTLSNEWKRHGGTNKEPKTDIISADSEYRVSLKQSGDSQLMSGEMGEVSATVECVFNTLRKNKRLRDAIDKLMQKNLWTVHNSFADNSEWSSESGKLSNVKLKEFLKQLLDEFPLFREAILMEAASGAIKFNPKDGGTGDAVANYILVWSYSGNAKVSSIKEYVSSHSNENIKFDIRNKSHKDRVQNTSLRIDTTNNVDLPDL